MGTIRIGVNKDQVSNNIREVFEQYLKGSANPKLNNKEREENKYNKRNQFLGRSGYQKQTYGYVDGKFIFVGSDAKPFVNRIYDYSITFHQSQFNNQEDTVKTFTKIFGPEIAKVILCEGILLRSDFWIDTEIKYDRCKQAIYRPGVSVSDQQRSDRRSYYLGTKGPKQAVFYEKEIEDRGKLDIKRKKPLKDVPKTRFEVKYFGKKVPIKHYSDYNLTSDMNLFDHIKTCLFTKEKFLEVAKGRRIDQSKLDNFLDVVEKEGLHHARKRFNKSRSFYRTIEPILKKAGKDLQLSDRWKAKVKKKIVGDFDINQYFSEQGV